MNRRAQPPPSIRDGDKVTGKDGKERGLRRASCIINGTLGWAKPLERLDGTRKREEREECGMGLGWASRVSLGCGFIRLIGLVGISYSRAIETIRTREICCHGCSCKVKSARRRTQLEEVEEMWW